MNPTSAASRFEKVILTAHNLIPFHDKLSTNLRLRDPLLEFSYLLHLAILLFLTAMDGCFKDVFSETLLPYLRKRRCADSVAKLIDQSGVTTKITLHMLAINRPYRRIRTLIEAKLQQHVTQQLDAIHELFVVYAIADISNNVAAKLRRKKLSREIEILVQQTHKIAHEGHLERSGKLRPLKQEWVRNGFKDVQLFAGACHHILQN